MKSPFSPDFELINKMSKLTFDQLKETVEEAKSLALKNCIDSIPEDEIERFKNAHQRLNLGQRISYKLKVPIKIDFKISAAYEFGGFEEVNVKVLDQQCSGKGSEWVKHYVKEILENEMPIQIVEDCATGIDGNVDTACGEETAVYNNFRKLLWDLEEKYKVDPWKLIEKER